MDIANAQPTAKPVAIVAPIKQEPVGLEAQLIAFNETELRQGWYNDEDFTPRIITFQHGVRPLYEWDRNTQPFV